MPDLYVRHVWSRKWLAVSNDHSTIIRQCVISFGSDPNQLAAGLSAPLDVQYDGRDLSRDVGCWNCLRRWPMAFVHAYLLALMMYNKLTELISMRGLPGPI